MFFPPCFRAESTIRIFGPSSPEASPRGADRPLHLGPALAGRGSRAALRRLLPRCAGERVDRSAARRSAPRPSPIADRRSATGSPTATRPSATSPTTSPALGADLAELERGVDLRLQPRPRRRPADPRLPVHRRGVPGPRGLGPLPDQRDAHLRQAGRGEADAALPPRPAPHRRLPRRPAPQRPQALGVLGGDPGADRDRAPNARELTVGWHACRRSGRRRGAARHRRLSRLPPADRSRSSASGASGCAIGVVPQRDNRRRRIFDAGTNTAVAPDSETDPVGKPRPLPIPSRRRWPLDRSTGIRPSEE